MESPANSSSFADFCTRVTNQVFVARGRPALARNVSEVIEDRLVRRLPLERNDFLERPVPEALVTRRQQE